MASPESTLLMAVDEKTRMQAIDRAAPILPFVPTTPARMTHDYVCHGTISLFAAYDISSGSLIAHRSITELKANVRKWINKWNKNPKPFV